MAHNCHTVSLNIFSARKLRFAARRRIAGRRPRAKQLASQPKGLPSKAPLCNNWASQALGLWPAPLAPEAHWASVPQSCWHIARQSVTIVVPTPSLIRQLRWPRTRSPARLKGALAASERSSGALCGSSAASWVRVAEVRSSACAAYCAARLRAELPRSNLLRSLRATEPISGDEGSLRPERSCWRQSALLGHRAPSRRNHRGTLRPAEGG